MGVIGNIDNTMLISRIPIILRDILDALDVQEKELVFDYENNDIYVNLNGELISITKVLRDSITEIKDGSMVIHIVTEDTLPPIKDREKNHWYFVVTAIKDKDEGKIDDLSVYVYYGVQKVSEGIDKNYILIAQNILRKTDTVHMNIPKDHVACFYVPVDYSPVFTMGGQPFVTEVTDRIYILTPDQVTLAYDVYTGTASDLGDCTIKIDLNGGATHDADEEMGTEVDRK